MSYQLQGKKESVAGVALFVLSYPPSIYQSLLLQISLESTIPHSSQIFTKDSFSFLLYFCPDHTVWLRLEVREVFFCILDGLKIEFVTTSSNYGVLHVCKVLTNLLPVCL